MTIINIQSAPYKATGNGTTDDTAAINAAYKAVTGQGDAVFWPRGTYRTSAPIQISRSGTATICEGPMATQGAAGIGTNYGVTLMPSATWSAAGFDYPAAFLIDGGNGGRTSVVRCSVERLVVNCKNYTGQITGIAQFGSTGNNDIRGCGVVNTAGSTSHGFGWLTGAGGANPDGGMIAQNMAQSLGGDGFHFEGGGDLTMNDNHAQNVGETGFFFGGGGGNIRVMNCRGDLGTTGFWFDLTSGSYGGMVQVDNCSTQRNKTNGLYINNPALESTVSPVWCSNCTMQGDGTADTGGEYAGFTVHGAAVMVLTGCGTIVNTVDNAVGIPYHSVQTQRGSTGAVPIALSVIGGFYQAKTAFANVLAAPQFSMIDTMGYFGGQWTYADVPGLITSL